jgi:hypothetical protein
MSLCDLLLANNPDKEKVKPICEGLTSLPSSPGSLYYIVKSIYPYFRDVFHRAEEDIIQDAIAIISISLICEYLPMLIFLGFVLIILVSCRCLTPSQGILFMIVGIVLVIIFIGVRLLSYLATVKSLIQNVKDLSKDLQNNLAGLDVTTFVGGYQEGVQKTLDLIQENICPCPPPQPPSP